MRGAYWVSGSARAGDRRAFPCKLGAGTAAKLECSKSAHAYPQFNGMNLSALTQKPRRGAGVCVIADLVKLQRIAATLA